jgi:hypothetical protein
MGQHDGYRLIVRRDGPSVRLYSRNANDVQRSIAPCYNPRISLWCGADDHHTKIAWIGIGSRCGSRETVTERVTGRSLILTRDSWKHGNSTRPRSFRSDLPATAVTGTGARAQPSIRGVAKGPRDGAVGELVGDRTLGHGTPGPSSVLRLAGDTELRTDAAPLHCDCHLGSTPRRGRVCGSRWSARRDAARL